MGAISTDYYISGNQSEIFACDINNRIEELKRQIREVQQDGDDPFVEDEEELAALIEFRDRVQVATGNHFDEATVVPDDLFEEHARDWAEGLGDFEFLAPYVNWEKFADDLKAERYTQLDFGDDLVHVR